MGYDVRHEICKAKALRRKNAEKVPAYDLDFKLNQANFRRIRDMYLMELYMASEEGVMDVAPIKITK